MSHHDIHKTVRLAPANRLAVLQRVLSAALLVGLLMSVNLWLPYWRSFPHASLVNTNTDLRALIDPLLTIVLVTSLSFAIFSRRPFKYSIVGLVSLAVLIAMDQMRLQPWVYQYLTLLLVLFLCYSERADDQTPVSQLRLLVAALYFWSGVQKLNYSFHQEVLPQLLGSIKGFSAISQKQLLVFGIGIASIEMAIGFGLLMRRLRKISLWIAIAMHVLILSLLVTLRLNTIVWPWNVTMIAVLLILFHEDDFALRDAIASSGTSRIRIARVLTLLIVFLPLSSFWGWWDLYLSGALYSGSTPVAVVRINQSALDTLGERARRHVFIANDNEQMLPFYEWSMSELNVPPYSDERAFKQITREICLRAADREGIELIVKGQPERFTARYEVRRYKCAEL